MSVSLLDLLSCGLASVVILLMLSLNTGMGGRDNVNQSHFIEITFHDARAINKAFSLGFQDFQEVVLLKQKESFDYLELPEPLDSIVGIRAAVFRHASDLAEYGRALTLQISIPEKAKGLNLSFDVDASSTFVEYSATNTFESLYNKRDTVELDTDNSSRFTLKYTGITEAWLYDGSNIIHTFPTLTSE